MTPDLSPLAPWLGHPDSEALALGAARAPEDDAPRLVLADWLRDRGADAAADLVAGARGQIGGWLAMLWYERKTGRSAEDEMPHLTSLFGASRRDPPGGDGTLAAVRRAAAGVIFKRADDWHPTNLRSSESAARLP